MREVVIASAARTPVGSFGGSLKGVGAVKLGTIAATEAITRAGIKNEDIDEVVFGCVLQAGQGQNVARQVAIHTGIPQEIPALTINKVCASGLRSVSLAAQIIKAGDADIILAGGTECMTDAPFALQDARWGCRMGNGDLVDLMIHDGLWEIFNGYHMGITAENIAEQWKLTREEQDEFGLASQLKAEKAIKLYTNRNPLPRAWLVKEFKVMDSQTILWTMLQKEFRPAQEVFLEEEPEWTNPPSPSFAKGEWEGLNAPLSGLPQKVQMMLETNNRLDLQVNARENSLLVLSDTYYPGWKAFVDGKETKIYRADYTFRAIPLNAGTHRVEFVYDPISFKLGAGVTLLGILGCLGMGWAARRRGRANRKSNGTTSL